VVIGSVIDNYVSNAVKKRSNPSTMLANLARAGAAAVHRARGDDKASVECSATEACLSVQSIPFCLDMMTGYFHDGTGITGDALSGDYTLADGRTGNMYTGPNPQATGGASSAAATTGAAVATGSAGGGRNGGGGGASQTASPGAGSTAVGGAAATQTGGSAATPSTTRNVAVKDKSLGLAVGGAMALLGVLLL
jgi:hypothetical protein